MTQRVKMGNVVAFYKANKSWMQGSFEDKLEKETDYNAFVKKNLTNSLVAFRKENVDVGASVVAPYQVTSGSLIEIECTAQTTGVSTNIYTGNLVITSGTTVGQISQAILRNNNQIVKGMQLSLVINLQKVTMNGAKPYIVARCYEFIIDDTSIELLSKYIPVGLLTTLDETGNPLFFDGSEIGVGGACFILSHTISGVTKVSTQSMILYGRNPTYEYFISQDNLVKAIASYGAVEANFLDSNSARSYNNVPTNNYIQALMYNNHIYARGAEVPLSNSASVALFFFTAIDVNSSAQCSLLVDGLEVDLTNWQVTWNTTYNRVTITRPEGYSWPDNAEVLFEITYDDTTIDFDFIATPGS